MSKRAVTVLLIEDNPGEAQAIGRHLAAIEDWDTRTLRAEDAAAANHLLASCEVDAILLDFPLQGETSLETLRQLRHACDQCAIVVIAGQGSERIAVELMRAGADDYLIKSDVGPAVLRRSLDFVLHKYEAIKHRARIEAELERLARTDDLTGLANRRHFMERLREEFQRHARYKSPFTVLLLDLDHFKEINDMHGHLVGDCVLSAVGRILREMCRLTDYAGRYGGEEFCLALTETSAEDGKRLAERIRTRIAEETFPSNGGSNLQATCSIGLAQLRGEGDSIADLLARADAALYEAKALGRNRVAGGA